MTFDASELFRALARHDVAYVTIGGMAIQVYGGQRLTQDLDVTIAAMRERAHEIPLGDVIVPVAHRNDLITLKRAAGRPQDLADIELLESLDDSD